jgi:hypothetical protein
LPKPLSVVQLFSGKKMLTISTGESQRPLKLRDGIDRRFLEDRRRSPVDMRLRVGLWYQYHRATRAGEFDPFPRDQYKRPKVEEALLPEMHKYEFRHRESNAPASPPCALARALDFLWAHPELGCNTVGESTAAYAINSLAEYLVRTFHVTVIDRRKADRRAAQASGV